MERWHSAPGAEAEGCMEQMSSRFVRRRSLSGVVTTAGSRCAVNVPKWGWRAFLLDLIHVFHERRVLNILTGVKTEGPTMGWPSGDGSTGRAISGRCSCSVLPYLTCVQEGVVTCQWLVAREVGAW